MAKPITDAGGRWRLSASGVFLGCLFLAASLTPSLMPRPMVWQGLLGGVALALGYGTARALTWVWHGLELPVLRHAALGWLRAAWFLAGLVSLARRFGRPPIGRTPFGGLREWIRSRRCIPTLWAAWRWGFSSC